MIRSNTLSKKSAIASIFNYAAFTSERRKERKARIAVLSSWTSPTTMKARFKALHARFVQEEHDGASSATWRRSHCSWIRELRGSSRSPISSAGPYGADTSCGIPDTLTKSCRGSIRKAAFCTVWFTSGPAVRTAAVRPACRARSGTREFNSPAVPFPPRRHPSPSGGPPSRRARSWSIWSRARNGTIGWTPRARIRSMSRPASAAASSPDSPAAAA